MRGIVKAFRRPPAVRLPDRNGGFPRLSGGVARGVRCPASLRPALLAESLGKPSLWVIINEIWYNSTVFRRAVAWNVRRDATWRSCGGAAAWFPITRRWPAFAKTTGVWLAIFISSTAPAGRSHRLPRPCGRCASRRRSSGSKKRWVAGKRSRPKGGRGRTSRFRRPIPTPAQRPLIRSFPNQRSEPEHRTGACRIYRLARSRISPAIDAQTFPHSQDPNRSFSKGMDRCRADQSPQAESQRK